MIGERGLKIYPSGTAGYSRSHNGSQVVLLLMIDPKTCSTLEAALRLTFNGTFESKSNEEESTNELA
jgi:hypothetical protein